MPRQPSFTCPACGSVSYNDTDIREGYCGNCHDWTGTFKDLAGLDSDWSAYDRQGHEITQSRAMWLSSQPGYKSIALTVVGRWRVSTVWLPFNHQWNPERPKQIFETMVFPFDKDLNDDGDMVEERESWLDDYLYRYPTEEDARAGHEAVVAEIRVTQDIADELVFEEVTNRWIL